MNLKCKKARVPIAAVGAAAIASGGLFATSAAAAGETLSVGSTSATVVNVNPVLSDANASTTFGVRVSGAPASDPDPLHLKVVSAPTGGSLYYQRIASNGLPVSNAAYNQTAIASLAGTGTAGSTSFTLTGAGTNTLVAGDWVWIRQAGLNAQIAKVDAVSGSGPYVLTLDRKLTETYTAANATDVGTDTRTISTVPVDSPVPVYSYATGTGGGDTVYLGATVPGTYTYRLFKNRNVSADYEAANDDSTPLLTFSVKDVTGQTGATTDDLDFNVSAPAIGVGEKVTATAAPTLTGVDSRGVATQAGGLPTSGLLGQRLAARMTFTFGETPSTIFSGGTGTGAPAYTGTGFVKESAATEDSGTVSTTPSFAVDSPSSTFTGAVRNTTVTSNGVTVMTLAPSAGQTGKVAGTGASVKIRPGVDTVSYTATAFDSGPDANAATATDNRPLADKVVTFTLSAGSGVMLDDLTVNGQALATTGPNAGKVTATTNSAGVATLVVKSSKNNNGNSYGIDATSGLGSTGTGSSSADIVATYETPVVGAGSVTSGGNTVASIGGKVVLRGKVVDQYGVGIIPNGSPQATLTVDRGSPTFGTADDTHAANIAADGTFQYELSDVTGNTAVRTDSYVWTVAGQSSTTAQVRWVNSVIPAQATITGLGANTTFPVPAATDYPIATRTATNEVTLTGVVKDANGAALPFGAFSLTGSAGVYFLDAAGKGQTTLTGQANESGQISSDGTVNGVKVVFTKSGEETKITLNAGAASATTGTFTSNQPVATEDWKVGLNPLTVAPGEKGTISGRVEDSFGNPVPGVTVTLALGGAAEFGVITSSTTPVTNDAGRFTALFESGKNDSGNVPVVATINGGTPVESAAGTVTTTGIAYQAGRNRATENIVVKVDPSVTLQTPVSRVGPGRIEISGTGRPNSVVDIWVKRTGTGDDFSPEAKATTDAEGKWGAAFDIVRSVTIEARQGTSVSNAETVTVFSSVTMRAEVKGRNVMLYADGNPNQATNMSFYHVVDGRLLKIDTVTTNSKGFGSAMATFNKGKQTVRAYYVATGTRAAFAEISFTIK